MKKITKYATCFSGAVFLALAAGCSKKPEIEPAPVPEARRVNRSVYTGLWEGRDKSGDIYTVRFTDTGWESRVEKDGVSLPYYRGTYTYTGTRLDLLITEEADPRTMGWIPQRGNLQPNLAGRLSGGVLKITALTEADLTRKF